MSDATRPGLSRRGLVTAVAATSGAAAGSGALCGFPAIWAQNIKNVEPRHAGLPVTAIQAIGDQASKDLGFKVTMQATESSDLLNRFLSQSASIDLADVSLPYFKYLAGRNILQTIPLAKFKQWDQTLPLFTRSEHQDGRKASMQGIAPYTVLYATDASGAKFATGPTEFLTSVPTITNADTLGIRHVLVRRSVTSWADLINPEFKGRAALQDNPTVGVIDVAMAIEAQGDIIYGNKGNMTKDEIVKTIIPDDEDQEIRPVPLLLGFGRSVGEPHGIRRGGDPVNVVPGRDRGPHPRHRLRVSAAEGGLSRLGFNLGMMKHRTGLKQDCAYEYLNWYNSGFAGAFIAREGYYSAQPANARKYLSSPEWDYWYDGKPAVADIRDPFGKLIEQAGRARDGGAFDERMGRIAVWNSVMDEDRYLTRRWNEFITS